MCAGDPGHKEEGSQGGIAALGRLPEKGQFCYWLFHAQSTMEVTGWEDHLEKVSLLLDVQFPVHHGGGETTSKRSVCSWLFHAWSTMKVIVWEGHLNRSLCHWLFMPSQPQRLVGGKATSHKGQFATGCLKDKSKVGGDF